MHVYTQEESASISIGEDITVTVLSIDNDVVHLGIEAPAGSKIVVFEPASPEERNAVMQKIPKPKLARRPDSSRETQ